MKIKLIDLDKKELGEIELDSEVFGLDVRPDIIKTVIDWQLAKRQAGTHQTKTISEVSGTTKKPHAQKGTGRARQGSLRQVHMRGGAVSHGPVARSHEYDLPKKIRRLGLRHALSAKMEENSLFVLKSLNIEEPKTSIVREKMKNFGFNSFFLIDDEAVDENFAKACSNLHKVNAVPQIGANVYDIIKHDCLLITEAAVAKLVARLK
jgi:large subunit ribosomal protein L4